MVYHWVYHISWYLVWTLSGYKDFSSISSNGGTAFDSSIPNYSKPESRWFQIVITWCLMVPRLSPISSVSRCMDMCGSFQVSDAWWCEKKVGIDTHTVTYVYIYLYTIICPYCGCEAQTWTNMWDVVTAELTKGTLSARTIPAVQHSAAPWLRQLAGLRYNFQYIVSKWTTWSWMQILLSIQ
jgi:hypothetical protein